MRVSTLQLHLQGIGAIQRHQSRLAHTQQQVATGRRILTPADDPAGAKRVLDLDQVLGLTRQYLGNADLARDRVALSDATLDSVGNVLHRARELAVQANNSTLVDADRRALAAELVQRAGELLGLANTKDGNNEYLYAGNATQTRPFSRLPGGAVGYAGDQGQRELQIGADYRVAVGDSGSAVFMEATNGNGVFATRDDPANTGTGIIDDGTVTDLSLWVPDTYSITFPTAATYEVRDGGGALVAAGGYVDGQAIAFNGVEVTVIGQPAPGDRFTASTSVRQGLFASLDALESALQAPVVTPADQARLSNAINRALADLDRGLEHVLQVRAELGGRLNAVEAERAANEGYEVHVQTVLSDIRDVDIAEAVSRLTLQANALQAAQASFARIQNLSLFEFI